MGYFKKQKASKYLRGADGSTSGAELAKEQSSSDPRLEQSPGEQDPTPSPSTMGLVQVVYSAGSAVGLRLGRE